MQYNQVITDGTHSTTPTDWIDLTNYVIEKPIYDTFTDFAEYTLTDRQAPNRKASYWYYTRGSNEIGGLTFTGTQPEKNIMGCCC